MSIGLRTTITGQGPDNLSTPPSAATPPPSRMAARHDRLSLVLARVRFPARRWELLACAIDEGWDVISLKEIESLPEGVYRDFRQVVTTLAREGRRQAKPERDLVTGR